MKADKVVYYYLKGVTHNPVLNRDESWPCATVCLVQNGEDGKISRGIAICSRHDNFVKKEGRKRAFNRAMQAATGKATSQPILNGFWDGEWRSDSPVLQGLYRLLVWPEIGAEMDICLNDPECVLGGYKSAYDIVAQPICEKEAAILAKMITDEAQSDEEAA